MWHVALILQFSCGPFSVEHTYCVPMLLFVDIKSAVCNMPRICPSATVSMALRMRIIMSSNIALSAALNPIALMLIFAGPKR